MSMSTQSGCPVVHGFQPLDPYATDDHLIEGWRRARHEAPVFYVPEQDWWCVSSYRLMEEVLHDPATYSSSMSGAPAVPVPDELRDELPDGWPIHPNIACVDPPEHTRIRKLAYAAFTPKAALARTDDVRRIAHAAIDSFIADGTVDLATQYTRMIPVNVIAPIWGVSPGDAPKLYQWAHEAMLMVINEHITPEQVVELARSQAEFDRYVRALVAERRAAPRGEDDLLTTLINATGDEDEPALSDAEIMALVVGVISAGTETSATAMGHAIHALLSEPGLWDEAVADRGLLDNVVEETLRTRPPVRGIHRVTTRECELGGVTIPAGATLHMPFLSAGRDEEIFADPDRFDPRRGNAKQHMTFGKSTHFCLGANLARVEIRNGLDCLMDRLPHLRLAPTCELHHVPTVGVPCLIDGLHVEWPS